MALFSRTMVEELQRLPGASHSFLKQVCAPDGSGVREAVVRALASFPDPVRERLEELLGSLDNRRFFQGFSELALAATVQAGGWEIEALSGPSRLVRALRPGGQPVNLLACGFVHSGRLETDLRTTRRLHEALGRVRGNTRFSVFVRKWLPATFDPEPVRQAVELWVREVEAGRWDNRFAAYEDESVALEFGLVGDLQDPARIQGEESPVLMTVGPFISGRTMGVVEGRLVRALDRYRMGDLGHEPVLLAAVADRPWQLSPGYMREFLYGKPCWVATSHEAGEPPWEAALSREIEPCLFKDSLYKNVAGVLMAERDPTDALLLRGRAMSNPLSDHSLLPGELPFRTLAEGRQDDGLPVLRTFDASHDHIRIGG